MKQKPRIGLVMRFEIESRVEALQTLDGILLPGTNSDVDPLLYGEETHLKLGRVVPEKDRTDLMF